MRVASWNLNESVPTDVVPVNPETVGEWKYPPYSGYYDGTLSLDRSDVMLTIGFQERGSGGVAALTTRMD